MFKKGQKRSDFVQKVIVLDGKRFELSTPQVNRDYLYPIYDAFYPELLLVFARQCEKSTTCANIALSYLAAIDYFKIMYLNASLMQISDFSKDKFDPKVMESPILKAHLLDSTKSYNVTDKFFRNGSVMRLRGLNRSADRTRGSSNDMIVADEVQDILIDHLIVAEESMSHSVSPYRNKIYVGTPKSTDNSIETLRLGSNIIELVYKCQSCNRLQDINERNIGKTLICRYCKKKMDRFSNRQWAVVQKKKNSNRFSFRIPQTVVPWVPWEDVLHKYETYPLFLFMNEVLALSHGASQKPVQLEDLLKLCGDYDFETHKGSTYKNVAGIDYGRGQKSLTVLNIYSFDSRIPKQIYQKKYRGELASPNKYIPHMLQKFEEYRVKYVGVDDGDGFAQNHSFIETLGAERVYVFYASHNLKDDIRFKADAQLYVFSRNKQLGKRFAEIKKGLLEFPKASLMGDYFQDFLNIYVDYTQNFRYFTYDHNITEPDDGAQAHNMAMMTAEQVGWWSSSKIYEKNSKQSLVNKIRGGNNDEED